MYVYMYVCMYVCIILAEFEMSSKNPVADIRRGGIIRKKSLYNQKLQQS